MRNGKLCFCLIQLVLMVFIFAPGHVRGEAELPLATQEYIWAQPVKAAGLPNLHRVSDKLYRSAQPTSEGMRTAKALGIHTVLSVRSGTGDEPLAMGTDLTLKHVSMRAWNPDLNAVTAALRAIEAAPGPVLVHCYHGADRTGLVVALYRMTVENWPREEAINEMLKGGYGYHSMWRDIIKFLRNVNIEALRAKLATPSGIGL